MIEATLTLYDIQAALIATNVILMTFLWSLNDLDYQQLNNIFLVFTWQNICTSIWLYGIYAEEHKYSVIYWQYFM